MNREVCYALYLADLVVFSFGGLLSCFVIPYNQTNQLASMELNTELQGFLDFAGEVLEHAEESVIVQDDAPELDAEEYIGLGALIAVC